MFKWPLVVAVITLVISFAVNMFSMLVWDLLTGVPAYGIVLLILGPATLLYGISSLLAREAKSRAAAKQATASLQKGQKGLEERIEALSARILTVEKEQMKEYTRDAMEMKKDVHAVEKKRIVVLDAESARDIARTEQVLTRREAGPPIDKYPVILHTDRKNVRFDDLQYEILTPNVAQFCDFEREVFGELTIFTIHNDMKRLIRYGETVTFCHQTNCDLVSPERDWIGVETSGGPNYVSIEIWFPVGYQVVVCHAYKGTPPNPDKDSPVFPEPRIEEAKLANESFLRTRIVWDTDSPEEDSTYYVLWEARRTTTGGEASTSSRPPKSDESGGNRQRQWTSEPDEPHALGST